MATIYANEGRLRVGFTLQGRRSEPLHLADNRANRRAAEEIARRLEASIMAGVFDRAAYRQIFPLGKNAERLFGAIMYNESTQLAPAIPTLGQFAAQWLEEVRSRVGPGTHYDYLCLIRKHLEPHAIAELPIDQVHDGHINLLIGDLQRSEDMKSGRINKVLARLRSIFKVAAARRIEGRALIEEDPMKRVSNLREPKTEVDPFTADEVQRILAAAQGWERSLVTVLIGAGLRPNEALHLKWPDIDFERGIIIVRRSGGRFGMGLPKTRSSERDVDLVARVAAALQEQRHRTGALWDGEGFVFPSDQGFSGEVEISEHTRRNPKTGMEIRVRSFTQAENVARGRYHQGRKQTPMLLTNFRSRNWRRIMRGAGIRPRTIYQCRHTFATLLLEQGESIQYVADQLGHRDLEMVIRHYARWTRKPARLVAGGAFSGVVTQGSLLEEKRGRR